MTLMRARALTALFVAHSMVVTPIMAVRTIKYTLIGQNDNAVVRDQQGNILFTVPQGASYTLNIDRNGSLSLVFEKKIINKIAMINTVNNLTPYKATYSIADSARRLTLSDSFPPGSTLFKQAVPWNRDQNYFVLEVTVN